jgi:YHS domain-containing protein
MKRLRCLLTAASVATAPIIAGSSVLDSPDRTTMEDVQGSSTNEQILVAQNKVSETKNHQPAKVNVDGKGVILKGYDAVAFFEQGKPVKGNPAIKGTYQGATYLFASEADKDAFEKDSVKYAPQYGGFCAYGVAKGALDDFEDLFVFTIYKGRLYLCGNPGALEVFMTNIDSNIERADANWQRLTGT